MSELICPDCGERVDAHALHTSPESGEAEVAEVADAAVAVAEIEAQRDVTIARIEAKAEEAHDETDVEALRAEISVMREMLNRLAPPAAEETEPAPAPAAEAVIVDAPAPEVEAPPAAEHEHHEPSARKKTGLGLW